MCRKLARVCGLAGWLFCCKPAGFCFLYHLEADSLLYRHLWVVIVSALQFSVQQQQNVNFQHRF